MSSRPQNALRPVRTTSRHPVATVWAGKPSRPLKRRIAAIIRTVRINPGTMPAMNNAPTEVSVIAPYTTMTIEGGIRIAIVPALVTMPVAYSRR